MRILISGLFSFREIGASVGDAAARNVVSSWLLELRDRSAGWRVPVHYPKKQNSKWPAVDELSRHTVEEVMETNWLDDCELYQFASKRVEETLPQQNDSFGTELASLRWRSLDRAASPKVRI